MDLYDPTQIVAICLPFCGGLWTAIALGHVADRAGERLARRTTRVAPRSKLTDRRLEDEAHPGQDVQPCSRT
jgi:hypothetical protein